LIKKGKCLKYKESEEFFEAGKQKNFQTVSNGQTNNKAQLNGVTIPHSHEHS
jgi:hypothetical protein